MRRSLIEVEQLVQKRFSLAIPALAVAPLVAITLVALALVRVSAAVVFRPARRRLRLRSRGRPLDDLVELAAIEPDAAALRTIVDLDALPGRHQPARLVYRTFHPLLLVRDPRC